MPLVRVRHEDISVVVGKILRGHHPILVPDQAVGLHQGGVEIQLQLHIPGNLQEGAPGLGYQGAAGLKDGIQIVVIAIAVIGQGVTLPAGVSVSAGQQVDENFTF